MSILILVVFNSYVDLLLGEFKHYKTRIAHGGIRKEVMLAFEFYGKTYQCSSW